MDDGIEIEIHLPYETIYDADVRVLTLRTIRGNPQKNHGLACGNHGFLGKQIMYEHSMHPPMILVSPDISTGVKITF